MSHLQTLLDRNTDIAADFKNGDLPIFPVLNSLVISCSDSRTDPVDILGLDSGEAVVVRSVGGRATAGLLQDVSILTTMAGAFAGEDADPTLVLVIHHTQCGASNFGDPNFAAMLVNGTGLSAETIADIAISDPAVTVKTDVEIIRQHPGVHKNVIVAGYVYDVVTASMTEVVSP